MVVDVAHLGEWNQCAGRVGGTRATDRMWVPGSPDAMRARERTWETRSEVVAADRARRFAWKVVEPPTAARWDYRFVAKDGGSEVPETWELPPEGSAFFEKMFRDDAANEIGRHGRVSPWG